MGDGVDRRLLGGRQRRLPFRLGGRGGGSKRQQERRQAVVQVVETFQIVDDPLVGGERARGQRLGGGLVDVEQPPAAQRSLGREHVPGRVLEQSEGEGEGRVGTGRIVLGVRAKGGGAGVELHGGAEEEHVALEKRETKPLAEEHQGRGGSIASAAATAAAASAICCSVTSSLSGGRARTTGARAGACAGAVVDRKRSRSLSVGAAGAGGIWVDGRNGAGGSPEPT